MHEILLLFNENNMRKAFLIKNNQAINYPQETKW